MSNGKRTLEASTNIINITPYKPNLLLKAKVTAKTSMKDFANNATNSPMFSCQLLDNTGEIRMTFFGEEASKFFEIIQIGKIYEIRYFKVKSALKQYNDLNHLYELNAVKNTTFDIDNTTPSKSIKLTMNFETLQSISELQEDCCKDIIAIIKSFDDVKETYSSIKNVTYKKRDIELIDPTETMITLTLWGDHSSDFKSTVGDIIVIKRAKVTIYQGIVKLSSTNSSIINYDYHGKERKK
ncbi:hypothetical protein QAD02_019091 [Eretmocerus hayati]|uniref:Uncharacterized protein n=2 Tax=Eretmocerus hayati TaxID=131215 RepID=A0ACC2PJW4_9HYME|nr:hypothetical protein QAD02_019090 [Eretmocerus hayati]KAJ8683299.1 hypothetical protein QAD02_019091 [Eretmocerus hayati]